MRNAGLAKRIAGVVLAALWVATSGRPLGAEPTNATPAAPDQAAAQDVLRAHLQVQEQWHATQLALERNRQEAEAAAQRQADALTTRLQALEQSLAGERQREFDALQGLQRLMLVFAGVFAGVALLAILVTTFLQSHALNRLASANASRLALPALAQAAPFPALGPGPGPLVPLGTPENANARLLAVIERLEKHIQEVEQLSPAREGTPVVAQEPGLAGVVPDSSAEAQANAAAARRAAQIELLMGKGQVLLDLDRAEAALACFDEALKLDPQHAEALVKKGAALERARQPDEAIACYDRAIAADRSFTMAYLHKGGLCNRLARHEEALQCYEEALKTQEHGA
jgi:tetratricopeptide (TPR) repeat protein